MLLISPTIKFLHCLGSGGFGAVYLAEARSQSGLSQHIAVKLLNEKMSQIKDIVARQRDEARLLGMLNHDHIVKVYDLGEINHQSAIFMEYIDGIDLRQLSQRVPIPPRIAVLVSAAVASALHAAQHTVNPQTGQPLAVIHRDIKPANILLSATGVPKVLDFGIARGEFEREGETKSVLFGTAHYMAPEQLLHGTQNASVDVFALGLTLWDLLVQSSRARLPLHEIAFNEQIQAMLQSLHANRNHRPLIPLLSRMLAYHPEDRPSAQTVEFELLKISDELGGPNLAYFAKQHVRSHTHSMVQNQALPQPTQSTNITIDGFQNTPKPPLPKERTWMWVAVASIFILGPLLLLLKPYIAPTQPVKTSAVIETVTSPPPTLQAELAPIEEIAEAPPVEMTSTPIETTRPTPRPNNHPVKTTQILVQHTINIHSIPAGKLIKVDDQQVGLTPIQGLPIAIGEHEVTLIDPQSGQKNTQAISINTHSPKELRWAYEEGRWNMLYSQ